MQLLNRLKEELSREDPEFDFDVEFYLTLPGAEIEPDHELVKSVQSAHKEVYSQDPQNVYGAIDSDASVLTHFGIPAINYGPRPATRPRTPAGANIRTLTTWLK